MIYFALKNAANSPTETGARNNTGATPTPDVYAANTTRNKAQVTFKNQPVRVKSPSGREYDIEWTAEDVMRISIRSFDAISIGFLGKRIKWFDCL